MIKRVLNVRFTVSNLERALAFYQDVLDFELDDITEYADERWDRLYGVPDIRIRDARLRLGAASIELMEVSPSGRSIPADSRSNDLWFQHVAIVVRDMEAAYARLREHDVQFVSSMPQTLPDYIPGAAGIKAFYFRDPDGHNLEVIWFPPGKGNPVWQEVSNVQWHQDSLFLGIDHTAIGVSSTKKSLAFYCDTLGLEVAGSSENYGSEQEHLNMVFGAHLEITGLTAKSGGMGVEFLDYRAPPGGRPMPADTRVNDLWYWETTMLTEDLTELVANTSFVRVSPIVAIDNVRQAIVLDPDGHALRVIETAT